VLPLGDASTVEEVAVVLGAIGTMGTVVLALWLQWFRAWRREPRLSLSLGRKSAGIGLRRDVDGVVDRLGLSISARPGRQTAYRVEVLLSAAWPVPSQPDWEYLIVDHEPLKWLGTRDQAGQPATQLSLAPGISREVSLAWIGRPLDLYERVGLERPTDEEVEQADHNEGDAARIATAFGIFDVESREDSRPFFIEGHLLYKLRIDLTARDIDTVSYELTLQVRPKWAKAEPRNHSQRRREPVEIEIIWSSLKEVSTTSPFAPMKWKTAYGDPPDHSPEASDAASDGWRAAGY